MAFSATLETSRRRWWLRWIKKEEISRAHSRCTHILTHTRIRWCSVEKILFPRGMKALLSRPALFDISDQVLLFSTLHSFSLLVFVSYSCLLLLYEFIKFGGLQIFRLKICRLQMWNICTASSLYYLLVPRKCQRNEYITYLPPLPVFSFDHFNHLSSSSPSSPSASFCSVLLIDLTTAWDISQGHGSAKKEGKTCRMYCAYCQRVEKPLLPKLIFKLSSD